MIRRQSRPKAPASTPPGVAPGLLPDAPGPAYYGSVYGSGHGICGLARLSLRSVVTGGVSFAVAVLTIAVTGING